MAATTFKYSPLNREQSEIRLLRLLPSNDLRSSVVCELEHVSLDKDVCYEALSYTWGGNVGTDSIVLDGAAFSVTSNLFAALCALRNEDSDCYLWIDVVCINQDDIAKRNQEVLRMLYIYQRARQVVVWLGEASDDSALAMSHLWKPSNDWDYDHDMTMAGRIIRNGAIAISKVILFVGASLGVARARPFITTWAAAFLHTPEILRSCD